MGGLRSARTRVIVFGLLTALALGYVEPIKGYLAQRAELERHEARLAALIEQRTDVREEIRLINTPPILQRRARELGMIRPNERPFVVRGELGAPARRNETPPSRGSLLNWLAELV